MRKALFLMLNAGPLRLVWTLYVQNQWLLYLLWIFAVNFSLDRIGHFVDAIKQKASCFSVCNWSHCCREANEVTHILARKASSKCFSHVWVEELPLFISSAAFRDFLVSRL
jgi:hypothetical protein